METSISVTDVGDVDEVPITILWLMAGNWTLAQKNSAETVFRGILKKSPLTPTTIIATTVEGAQRILNGSSFDLAIIAACAHTISPARQPRPDPRGGLAMIDWIRGMNPDSCNNRLIPIIMSDRYASMLPGCASEKKRISVVAEVDLSMHYSALGAVGRALGDNEVARALKKGPQRSGDTEMLRRTIAGCRMQQEAVVK